MTVIAIAKCMNGYIVLVESEQRIRVNGIECVTEWMPDTAHVFTEYAELVDWLYTLFKVSEEKKQA